MENNKDNNQSIISVSLKRRPGSNSRNEADTGKGTLYLQVICRRKSRQISLPYRLYKKEWDEKRLQAVAYQGCLPERCLYLIEINQKAKEEIKKMQSVIDRLSKEPTVSAKMIIDKYKALHKDCSFTVYVEKVINQFAEENREASVRHYRSLRNSLLKSLDNEDILLTDIDEQQVKRYEEWMIERKLHVNTIAFYMRNLKALWNRAVREGLIEERPSPFKGINTSVGKSKKKAVDEEVIRKIENLEIKKLTVKEAQARLFFLFSYYTQGMAFIDLAHLTDKNIQGDYLVYIRHKTGETIRVKLLPVMNKIINHLRKSPKGLLFPILSDPDASYKEYESQLRLYNGHLAALEKMVGAELSSYVARHSWATHSKNLGAPDSDIAIAMGHTNVATTQKYIDSSKNNRIDMVNKKLVMGKHRKIKVF